MTVLFNIEIAGIRFEVWGSHRIILENFNPAYAPFLKQSDERNTPADIKLYLEPGSMDIEGLKQIFDSGQSWSMYKSTSHYVISMDSPALENPLWTVKTDTGFSRATVFFAREFLLEKKGRTNIPNPLVYPLDQILTMYILASKKGALVHAAGAGINGKGFIFPGTSGAGKSTIARRFTESGKPDLLSDDRVVVRKTDDVFHAFGTPWPGEAGIAENRHLPLSGLFFLQQSDTNRINAITPGDAFKRLLPVTSIPWYDREPLSNILFFCEDLITRIPAYELEFRDSAEVVGVMQEFASA